MYPISMHTERTAQRDDVLPLKFPVKDRKTGELIHSVRITKGQVRFRKAYSERVWTVLTFHPITVDDQRTHCRHATCKSHMGS